MMEHKQIHWTLKACVIRCNMCNKVKKLVLFCKCLWCNLWNHSVLLANTGCSKKTRTTLVVNIFRTTNDTMIPFGLCDTETHEVFCTPSIHFNVSSICYAQDIKVVHEFLPCYAQHACAHQCACRQLWSKNEDPAGLPPWCCRQHLTEKKIKGSYVWWSWGPGVWSVSANPATWKFIIRDSSNN